MQSVLIVIHILIVIALVAVVLLQRSEGGALGTGGGTGNFMTGRGPGERAVACHRGSCGALLRHLDPDVGHRRLEPRAALDSRQGPGCAGRPDRASADQFRQYP